MSHGTIYIGIYALATGEVRRQLIACLRPGRVTRMPRTRRTDRRGQMPDMVSIHLRPPVVVNRLMHGGWVGDFNKGAGNNSAVAALAIAHQPLGAATVDGGRHGSLSAEGFSAKLKSIAEPMRRSCNYDQGTEMSWHKKLSGAMGVKVYFFDPHSP